MKLRLLPSSFNDDGSASAKQHLTCFIVNGKVAFDAGSLAMGATEAERNSVRDVVLSHAHLDHTAGLPLFVDDLFATLTEPVRVHACEDVIEALERDVFNWTTYPRFTELSNAFGPVLEFVAIANGEDFEVGGLKVKPLSVNHKVPSSGFLLDDGASRIALTGDTSAMDGFWDDLENEGDLSAVLIECAFPNHLAELAEMSYHLTPAGLSSELKRFGRTDCPIYVINIKPNYREQVVSEIQALELPTVRVLEVGRVYEW